MAELIKMIRRTAVRGQLDTAIEFVFLGGDPVSAHVLASAASEVLRGLAKHHGHEPFDAIIEKRIRRENRTIRHDSVNRHYNFFKHADRDAATDAISFNPETTIFEILAGLEDYATIFKQLSVPMAIFRGYFLKTYPDLFVKNYLKQVESGLRAFDVDGATPKEAAAKYIGMYKNGELQGARFPDNIEL